MGRPKGSRKIPKYPTKPHSSGQARIRIGGRDRYLGAFASPESREAYDRAIAEWLARDRMADLPAPGDITISEVCAAFAAHRSKLNVETRWHPYRATVRALVSLYGGLRAVEFGAKKLKALRAHLEGSFDSRMYFVGKNRRLSRRYINAMVRMVCTIFRWAASEELVPGSVPASLFTVTAMRIGETTAPESKKVGPVPEQYVDAVCEVVQPAIAAMIRLQLYTGMRGGEVCIMRTCDIDTTGRIWTYTPRAHKTQHLGSSRTVYLGPRAQAVLAPWLLPDLQAYLFTASRSAELRRQAADQRVQHRREESASLRARAADLVAGNPSEAQIAESRGLLMAAQKLRDITSRDRDRAREYDRQRKAALRAKGSKPRPATQFYSPDVYATLIKCGCRKADELAHNRNPSVPADVVLVPNWHPHQLRHAAATNLRKEFGIEAARLVLGHTDAATTLIYAEKDTAKVQDIMARVG